MDILDQITSDELEMIGYKWAEQLVGDDWPDDEITELLQETFVNGFLAGAVQIRAIIEEFGNKKEVE